MRIDIITVLPEMLEGFVHESILARAEKKGLAEIRLHNLRDYTKDKWRRVDDYPFGGQAGMVMQIEPIDRCIAALKEEREYDEVIFTSPDGEQFNQKIANDLSLGGNFIILAGHYKGVDQRVRDHLITREISVGDFVLTGGELPAAIIADAVVRLVHQSTLALAAIMVGMFQRYFSVDTRQRLNNGSLIKQWNEPKDCVLTS